MTFHVNPANGAVGKCTATQGKCPFGSARMDNHYETEPEAYNASVAMLASRYGAFTVHSQTARLEAAIFDEATPVSAKRELLKEYLATNRDEVYERLEDNAIDATEGREPEEVLTYASDRVVANAIAEAQDWKRRDTYYDSPADIFVALDEAAQLAVYEEAHAQYQQDRTVKGLPLEQHEIEDVYSDEPAKAMGMRNDVES